MAKNFLKLTKNFCSSDNVLFSDLVADYVSVYNCKYLLNDTHNLYTCLLHAIF